MLSARTPSTFTIPESIKICSVTYGYVIQFAENLNTLLPHVGFLQPINGLKLLKTKIEQATGPFLSAPDLDRHVRPILSLLINWKPEIKNQLTKFWQGQLDIGNTAVSHPTRPQYDPLERAGQMISKINEVNNYYLRITDLLHRDPMEKSCIYGLFYAHVLRTETAEYAFRKHFEELLLTYGLNTTYDAHEIFSVESKVSNRSGGFNSDGRAIRDHLAHYQYDLTFNSASWEIKFDDSKPGYFYNKQFTDNEFLTLMENTDLLYKSQLHLIWLYVGIAVTNNAFII